MTSNTIQENPQNPFHSYIVSASAGAGKTYQLSHRFLYLVGAGSEPENILTVTFTEKAAGEMRQRIIEESSLLLKNETAAKNFEKTLREFANESGLATEVRTANATAKLILSRTQALQIVTIDAVFLDWVSKFKFEASDKNFQIPQQFEIPSDYENEQIGKKAWEQTLREHLSDFESKPILSPNDIENRIKELSKSHSFYWLCEQFLGESTRHFKWDPELAKQSIEDLIASLDSELRAIAETSKSKKDIFLHAIATRDYQTLRDQRLFTKDHGISGSTIRGKNRESVANEIEKVEESMGHYFRNLALKHLDAIGAQIDSYYKTYISKREKLKQGAGKLEFGDLSQAAYRLFAKDEAVGARFMIQKKTAHLMLDEFQDTSRLQWSIFRSIALEMLAGEGLDFASGLKPSIFIVGDPKQSIYGFREADAAILEEASKELKAKGVKTIGLNKSFRTSQIVLDLVNHVFDNLMTDFPKHETAVIQDKKVVQDIGSVSLAPVFEGEDGAIEEAEAIASFIEKQVSDAGLVFFDKNRACLRRLSYRDCVVLFRSGTNSSLILEALQRKNIPARREQSEGFFSQQEIIDVLNLLKFLADANDQLSFLCTINAKLLPYIESDFLTYMEAQSTDTKTTKYHKIINFIEVQSQRYPETSQVLLKLIKDSSSCTAVELLDRCWRELNIYHRLISQAGSDLSSITRDNLELFYQLTVDFSYKGVLSLRSVLDGFAEMARADNIASSAGEANAVTLMTIHKSKGLEFPLVCVSGIVKSWAKDDPYWLKRQSGLNAGFYYRGTSAEAPKGDSFYDKLIDQQKEEAIAENRRLLYVALTRAQYHLFLSGHRTVRSTKENEYYEYIASFFAERASETVDLPTFSYQFLKGREWKPVDLPKPLLKPIRVDLLEILNKQEKNTKVLPKDLKTLAPAKLLAKNHETSFNTPRADIFAPFSKECGTYIHRILELKVQGTSYSEREEWEKICVLKNHARYEEVFQVANKDIDKLIKSEHWKLIEAAKKHWTEKPIAYCEGDQLIRGIMDLVVWPSEDEAIIVDYKTVAVDFNRTDLEAFAIAKQYDKQLSAYVKGMKKLLPGTKVKAAVFFTHSAELIYF